MLIVGGESAKLENGEWLNALFSQLGVRQGDPLGPLLFSIAMRPILQDLQRELGPDRVVIAYLDDIYILSATDDPLDAAKTFFKSREDRLTLNEDKCETYRMEKVREKGIKILGSFVGPKEGREKFLRDKVDKQIANLTRLSQIHSQHALLILRLSYQQNLRHLQRSLDTSDLPHLWAELDAALFSAVKLLRSSSTAHRYDDEIISLPIRLGGMGILSHQEVAPFAKLAADEMADAQLSLILEDGGETDVDLVRKQGERCMEAFEKRSEVLLGNLDREEERKTLVENGMPLARKWLTAIPFNDFTTLSNHDISVALHYRTLIPPKPTCDICALPSPLGHDETCDNHWKYARHNAVLHAIGEAIQTVKGTGVFFEPASIGQTNERNDLRITGSYELGSPNTEHDIKIYSLHGKAAHKTTAIPNAEMRTALSSSKTPIRDFILHQCDRYLGTVAARARAKAPAGIGKFSAIVISTGGLVEKDTAIQMKEWQKTIEEAKWAWTMKRISIGLVRARAKMTRWRGWTE